MSRPPTQQRAPGGTADLTAGTGRRPATQPRHAKTSRLKVVPETRALREALRARCIAMAGQLDKSRPPTKGQIESIACRVLEDLGHPQGYIGWTMVTLASVFWREQVAAVPPERRLLLLPRCLKHVSGCSVERDQTEEERTECAECSVADFRTVAEQMGYKVLVAEGSPVVLKILVSGHVDAIVGVACLNVLERVIDKILASGIPCMAVPLLRSDCRATSVDGDWVREMIHVEQKVAPVQTRTYLHLMRSAERMFRPAEIGRLVPSRRGWSDPGSTERPGLGALDPVAATEAMAHDFLGRGGKHLRPFITLATYDAMTGGRGTCADGPKHLAAVADAVHRTALSMEAFHKASLVHDDIEDDDAFRYGEPTLHRRYGVATAINVGDYLIGLGYRLVSQETATLGADVAADILDRLAEAHMKLSEGQGAELLWRDAHDKTLSPADALRIYALKTAPAFEAALYAGLRLAGPVDPYVDAIKQLARSLGIAFQLLNDLKDWQGDDNNKLRAGEDVLHRRPTALWAMAAEVLGAKGRRQLDALVSTTQAPETTLDHLRQLYETARVFEKAHLLVDKYQERAERVVDRVDPEPLRRLFNYLIDTVLERPASDAPQVVPATLPSGLPVVA